MISLLTQPFPPCDTDIAGITGVHRNSIRLYRKQLQEVGLDWVTQDGRERSGRRTQYAKAWAFIEEFKVANPESGGRDIWTHLLKRLGWHPEEVPSMSRIDAYLSEKRLVAPRTQGKIGNKGEFWLYDKIEGYLDCVQMDTVFPFNYAGQRLKVLDIRDAWTGAVYCEPFPMDFYSKDHRGLDELAACGMLYKWCSHFGIPKVLRLDNGAGQIIMSGHCPEFVRHAMRLGIIVEWEPYGVPMGNSFVERWHGELQKQWSARMHTEKVRTSDEAFARIRQIAFEETFWFPRSRLGKKAPADCYPIRPWEFGNGRPSISQVDKIGKGNTGSLGKLRMHRRVEVGGMVQLHADEYLKCSEALIGGKVRIDFLVEPSGGGTGVVLDSKGETVMTFSHKIELGHGRGERMTHDHKGMVFGGGEDSRRVVMTAETYNRDMERAHKNKRSKGLMETQKRILNGEDKADG